MRGVIVDIFDQCQFYGETEHQIAIILSFMIKQVWVPISAGHLLWIYRQLIGMSYIALARQVQIHRNISDLLGRLGS